MHQIHVELGKNSYPIYIDDSNLSKFGSVLKRHLSLKKITLVTNETINGFYGNIICDSILSSGIQVEVVIIPDGEEYKSLEWAGKLFDSFVDFGMTRHSGVVALGGGVIGDLAGFAAATFMRGISFVQIPTSLIAQVDSSVGGKTAVNHPRGKNLIGAFHQPKFVFIDVSVLKSLPERELKSGFAEVIKHAVIMDKELFEYMDDNVDKIMDIDIQSMEQIVSRSCKDKATIVEQDEKEQNIRAILNYGHTIGHSVESVSGYSYFRHGEAVSIGMAVAARIAVNMGILDDEQEKRQNLILSNYGLPVKFPDLETDEIIKTLYLDKKIKENKKLRFVLAKKIGKAIIVEDVMEEQVHKAIEECR
ncbi:3-dehydroquinate synthase [Candidatus Poribacteria bacterium]|nr:3-dehydroquinate synthase [Candidatus Poribacteria bacterium]